MENKMSETTIDAEAAAAIDVNGDGHISAEEMAMQQLRAMAEAKRLRRRVAEAAAEAAWHRIAKQIA